MFELFKNIDLLTFILKSLYFYQKNLYNDLYSLEYSFVWQNKTIE